MSASMLRRLSLGVLVLALAFPRHAAAMPWQWGDLFGKVRGFLSSILAPNGCVVEPGGRCGAAPNQIFGEIGCELGPGGRCAAAPDRGLGNGPILGEIGCEIEPGGHCKG